MSAFSRWLMDAWYSPRPVWFFIPLAWLFWLLSRLRRALYRDGLLRSAMLPLPVIVVGNISVGGTGKTPFIIWLAAALKSRGYRPGIVTRGYGGDTNQAVLVRVDSDPQRVGDEAVLLARRTGLPVVACRDRVAAARLLMEQSTLDVLLSDDGLQHYRLPRSFEIVMLDGERGLGNGWLLPAGPLRETQRRLDEVSLVIIKQSGSSPFTWPDARQMVLETDTVVSLTDGQRLPLQGFAGQRTHAVAGIGNPEQFFAALRAAGLQVDGRPLPDHAHLVPANLEFGDQAPVFMTEKDAVKCSNMVLPRHWYLEASARFAAADETHILERVMRMLTARGVQPKSPN